MKCREGRYWTMRGAKRLIIQGMWLGKGGLMEEEDDGRGRIKGRCGLMERKGLWKRQDNGEGVLMEREDKRKMWADGKERMMEDAGWRMRRKDGRGAMMEREY